MVPSIVPCDIASKVSLTWMFTGTAPKFSAQRENGAPPLRSRRPWRSAAVLTGLVVSAR
jgi:hypothetical protein